MAARKTQSKQQKRITILVLVALAVVALVLSTKLLPDAVQSARLDQTLDAARKPVAVHYIDVGQGDCALIATPAGNILIDSGERAYAEQVIAYLRNCGIQQLDYVIGTHPHSDHIGAMPEILTVFPVKNIILPKLSEVNVPTTKVYENLLLAVKDSGAKVHAAIPGDVFTLEEVTLRILGPHSQHKELNDMSVIAHVSYGDTSFLFTGDAENSAENELLEFIGLEADVYSAGHHGSRNASSEAFLRAVYPALVIISCGSGNSYGHPHQEALDRFAATGAQVLRTDICGSIVVGSDGKDLSINYEHQEAA